MGTRICSVCKKEKPLSEFGFHHDPGSRKGDPCRKYCKDCQAKKGREWRADPAHKDSLRQTYLDGKERVKDWKQDHYAGTDRSEYNRKYRLKYDHNMTPKDYDDMLQAQDGKCAICGATRGNGRWESLAIDHDHKTGKIRGLLCTRCNQGIGAFQDNSIQLRKAAEYLDVN